VQGFREHELPLSAIHLDIDYMRAYRVFTIDETRFPDLAKLAKELADAGTRMVTILDPGVMQDPGFSLFDEGVKRKMFCLLPDGAPVVGLVWPGWSVFPDFTNPDVRDWWGEQYRRLLDDGIAGFWHDMNEPSCFTAWGGFTLPTPTQHAMEGRGGNHRQGHNLYGLLMDRAGYEGLRKLRPEQRPWLLSRSGWVGLQRFAWNWTGDTETSWQSLQMTIPTVLGLGFSGIPYSGPDIGGFSGNPSAELFVRWFHLACFLPFFRTHSATGTLRREPWVFGEPYTSIIRKILQLRYSLIPYLYSLAWESSQHGFPIVRPLFWKEPEQERLWQVSDAFLLGNSLLVAPILEEGSQERELSLPSGEWYHFWDDALFEAKQNVRLEAPLDRIPLLVRAGCVLPMDEHGELVLHVYPAVKDSDGEAGFLYSDEGDGYGDWRVDRFQMKKRAEQLNVLWEKDGEYPFSYSKIHVQFHGWQPGKVWVDDKQVPVEDQRVSITAPFHTLQTNR
jgi:alpha-glucosidase